MTVSDGRHRQAQDLASTTPSCSTSPSRRRRQPRRSPPVRAGVRRQGASATAWARSRAPARARSRPSSPRAQMKAVRSAALRLLRPRRQASRINKRGGRGAHQAGAFDKLHADRAAPAGQRGLAFDYADTQAAPPTRAGLFDFGGDDHGRQDPGARAGPRTEPWSIKERLLGFEKTAVGFYLSGHLFDQSGTEGASIRARRIADLMDSREPQRCWPASSAICAWSTASAAASPSSSSTTGPAIEGWWPRSCSTPTRTTG